MNVLMSFGHPLCVVLHRFSLLLLLVLLLIDTIVYVFGSDLVCICTVSEYTVALCLQLCLKWSCWCF